MKFSDLTPPDLAALRLLAALEQVYPDAAEKQGKRRASVVLEGYRAWKLKTWRVS